MSDFIFHVEGFPGGKKALESKRQHSHHQYADNGSTASKEGACEVMVMVMMMVMVLQIY